MSWIWHKTASSCDTQHECGNVRLPSITVASPHSGLQRQNTLSECGNGMHAQMPLKNWVGMSARTGNPVKTVVPKSFMASTTVEAEIGGANRHKSSVGNVSGLASCQVWEAGSGHCGESSKHLRKFRVNTLRGGVCEVVETLSRRKVDVCCIQETRYRGGNCHTIKGKDTRYKLYWSRNNKDTSGLGVFVVEEWIEKVFDVQRVSDKIILAKLIVGQRVVTFLSEYAPQSGLSDEACPLISCVLWLPGSQHQNFWSHVEIGTAM